MTKRDRKKGKYFCSYEGCGKAHTRMDHLKRHERTHDPKQRYFCHWPGCGQTFTRSDVRLNHYKKHEDMTYDSERSKQVEEHKEDKTDEREESEMNIVESEVKESGMNIDEREVDERDEEIDDVVEDNEVVQTQELHIDGLHTPYLHEGKVFLNNHEDLSIGSNGGQTLPQTINHTKSPDQKPQPGLSSAFLSPSDLINLFFLDENPNEANNGTVGIHPNYSSEYPNGFSPLSELEKMFLISPNFPQLVDRTYVDETIYHTLLRSIPTLANNLDFQIPKLIFFIEVYWLVYHPQYPILHRPSFSTRSADSLLLLAMIMIGAALSYTISKKKANLELVDPKMLAEAIAEPLRWLIFTHPHCKPPAQVWIVQCLLILETFEITSTTRSLHERAYMFHGAKIQLLRRSPILGGDPQKEDEENDANIKNHSSNNGIDTRNGNTDDYQEVSRDNVWQHWIENESMKRATFMAFYLDTVHATVYGHLIILYAHQIYLSLPCEDKLWEFDNSMPVPLKVSNGAHAVLPEFQTPKFHAALRELLKKKKVETSSFGKKILLGGLLTIMFQMLQKDLRLSNKEWDAVQNTWKDAISLAIDVWRREVCNDDCCYTTNSLFLTADNLLLISLPTMLSPEDKRCKYSIYHISQIYLRITHYDYIIYAGAPSRMNVPVRKEEYDSVSKRISKWSKSLHGRISVIHAYLFLFEMLLVNGYDDLNYSYDPNSDPFLHRKNIVISAILVIFAYNFSLFGPESKLSTYNGGEYDSKEDGYSYLRRIRGALIDGLDIMNPNSVPYNDLVKTYAGIMPNIPNSHHLVGLLKLFYESYKNSHWEIGREYSNLLRNCIQRCAGRARVTCYDMYEKSVNNPYVY